MKNLLVVFAVMSSLTALKAQNPGVSDQDKEFTQWALKDNMAEMKFAEMAMNKGFSPAVKELAQHMMDDHKKTDEALKKLATERAIAMPTGMDEEQEKEWKKLNDKEGEDFDKCYTDYMIATHKKAISAYEKQSKKGENTELRAFANNTLTGLNHHKNMADETAKKIKKS